MIYSAINAEVYISYVVIAFLINNILFFYNMYTVVYTLSAIIQYFHKVYLKNKNCDSL
jgi:hypothetical protein